MKRTHTIKVHISGINKDTSTGNLFIIFIHGKKFFDLLVLIRYPIITKLCPLTEFDRLTVTTKLDKVS